MRSRGYTCTWNNYPENWLNHFDNLKYTYFCYAPEVGASGTPHIQFYLYFKNKKSADALYKQFPNVNFEKSVGTPADNRQYVFGPYNKNGKHKPANPLARELGELPQQGKRTDIDRMKELVVAKAPMSEIVMEAQSFQAVRFAEVCKYHLMGDRTKAPEVHWRWGLAGVGKTRYCFDNFDEVYIKDGTMWWNGYNQEQCICIDDFDGKWPFRDLLRLLDRYPYQGQYKGGYVKINSDYIVITCEFPPEYFWEGNELAQVSRRLTSVTEVLGDDPHVVAQRSGVITDPDPKEAELQFLYNV